MDGIHVMSLTFLVGLLLGVLIEYLWSPTGFITGG